MQQSSVWGLLLACCKTEAEQETPLITVTQSEENSLGELNPLFNSIAEDTAFRYVALNEMNKRNKQNNQTEF